MTGGRSVAGNILINVLGIKAIRAMVGVASTGGLMAAIVASEIFFNFSKVFRHRFDKMWFGGRISQVEN